MKEAKKILLYGAGYYGRQLLDLLPFEYEALAFVDGDIKKQGATVAGLPVLAPEEIGRCDYAQIVVTFPNGAAEAARTLVKRYGVPEEKLVAQFPVNCCDLRLASLRRVAREIEARSLWGCVAEVGVYRGDFARCINAVFPERTLYLFDTFEGFNEADVAFDLAAGLSADGDTFAGKYAHGDVRALLARMPRPERCIVRKGFFPQTAEGLEETFAFVSLDVDLYKPMHEGLRYFYPRLAEGGCIFVHDYANAMFGGVREAVAAFCAEARLRSVPLCDLYGSLVIVK